MSKSMHGMRSFGMQMMLLMLLVRDYVQQVAKSKTSTDVCCRAGSVPASTAHPAVAPAATLPSTIRHAGAPVCLATSLVDFDLVSSADASMKTGALFCRCCCSPAVKVLAQSQPVRSDKVRLYATHLGLCD